MCLSTVPACSASHTLPPPAYLRDFAMNYQYMAESFETSVPWHKVLPVQKPASLLHHLGGAYRLGKGETRHLTSTHLTSPPTLAVVCTSQGPHPGGGGGEGRRGHLGVVPSDADVRHWSGGVLLLWPLHAGPQGPCCHLFASRACCT